eukprot:305932-Chlamydomonas_euryale.AAC.1
MIDPRAAGGTEKTQRPPSGRKTSYSHGLKNASTPGKHTPLPPLSLPAKAAASKANTDHQLMFGRPRCPPVHKTAQHSRADDAQHAGTQWPRRGSQPSVLMPQRQRQTVPSVRIPIQSGTTYQIAPLPSVTSEAAPPTGSRRPSALVTFRTHLQRR